LPSPKDIAQKWFAAFNVQDIDALLSLYADDAQHFSPRLLKNHPETNGMIKGKAAMREWWQGAFDRMPTLRYFPVSIREENDLVYLEYKRTADNEEDMIVNESLRIESGRIIFSKVL
jgi:ketosteroid isomerase-like protein